MPEDDLERIHPLIPNDEFEAFVLTARTAYDLAGAGCVMSGYRCLMEAAAQAQEEALIGDPGEQELAKLYEQALSCYISDNGAALID